MTQNTVTVYRAINSQELQEFIDLNGGDATDVLARDGELDFDLHRSTGWDSKPENWPTRLINHPHEPQRVVVSTEETLLDSFTTEHMRPPVMRPRLDREPGFILVAQTSARIKVKIFALAI